MLHHFQVNYQSQPPTKGDRKLTAVQTLPFIFTWAKVNLSQRWKELIDKPQNRQEFAFRDTDDRFASVAVLAYSPIWPGESFRRVPLGYDKGLPGLCPNNHK